MVMFGSFGDVPQVRGAIGIDCEYFRRNSIDARVLADCHRGGDVGGKIRHWRRLTKGLCNAIFVLLDEESCEIRSIM
jgi:hypothetical protein